MSAPIISRPSNADIDVEAFIARMNGRYSPTRRLQADEDALNAAVDDYRRVLARFDKQTMEAAWRLIVERHDSWCWPHVNDVLQACKEARHTAHPASEAGAWVEKATEQVDAYMRRFGKTQVAIRAREGGYEPKLKEFIRAVAWVQSQYILGREGVAYDSTTLFGGDLPRNREAEEAFFEKARAQARSGHMRVTVPPGMMRRWAQEAEQGRGR